MEEFDNFKISYIVVCYNSEKLIADCIRSIIKYNKDNAYEIIIVDNSPSLIQAKTRQICEKQYSDIIFVPSDNVGYGAGNNKGIKLASGNIICIVNPDVRFTEVLAQEVKLRFLSNKNLGLIGFKQVGGHDLSFYVMPQYFIPFINSLAIKFFNRINFFVEKLFFLSGACFFISKEKFENIGLFDENIFMYNEEADIATRLLKMNYNIVYCPDKSYYHMIDERKEISDVAFNYEIESLIYYLKKYKFNVKAHFALKKAFYRFFKPHLFRLLENKNVIN